MASAINHRAALAGINMLQGMSTRQALLAAGYAETTARKPKHAGLTAERCIEEAVKMAPEADPSKIVESARMALGKRLAGLNSDDAALKATPLVALARTAEVVERWFGDKAPRDSALERAMDDGVTWAAKILAAMQREARKTTMGSGESDSLTVVEVQPIEPESDNR